MKLKTSELTGSALDYSVAIAKGIPSADLKLPSYKGDSLFRYIRDDEGELTGNYMTGPDLLFSRKWEAAGPIIEKEQFSIAAPSPINKCWTAMTWRNESKQDGPTLLIAAMRCYVQSKLGDEVEIPNKIAKF